MALEKLRTTGGESSANGRAGAGTAHPGLLSQHLDDLRKSGLDDGQIRRCGFSSVADPERIARILNWKKPARGLGACLAIPYLDGAGRPTGYTRLKPDRPRPDKKEKKPIKYESPAGQGNRAYIPPGTRAALADPAIGLIITEGEKKGARADQEGFACLGLVGIYGWAKKRKDKEAPWELIDDLAAVAWKGRTVYLCFDSDRADKVQIRWAEWHLAQTLMALGAVVKIGALPPGPVGEDGNPAKVGLDDYLCAHTADDLRQLLARAEDPRSPEPADLVAEVKALIDKLPQEGVVETALRNRDLIDALVRLERQDAAEFALARQRLRELGVKVGDLDAVLKAARRAGRSSPSSPCSPGSPYQIRDRCIWQRKHTLQGEVLVPLCNFVAFVTESVRVDDGSGEIEHQFTVAGELADGTPLPAVTVRASEFSTLNWVLPNWGMRANVAAGLGARDHLRAALQEVSRDAVHRVVYKHTGWRKLGDDWAYLHGGGAISTTGPVEGVLVQLDDRLRHYVLPPPPTGSALVEAVRASLRVLQLGPDRVVMPCLGAVYRAVLGRIDSSVSLVGATAMGKSEFSALLQQHFGPGMVRLCLPGNWSSTANALEGLAFLAKDALFTIDEFKPGGSKYDVDEMHRKAERVLRAQGNQSGRQRCRPDGTIRPSREPRGLILITGEDNPRGESLQARVLLVTVGQGDIKVQNLTPFQKDAAEGLYAQAMAGYLQWLAGRYEDIQEGLPQRHAELRTKAAAGDRDLHPRVPGTVADLFLGWRYWLTFAAEAGAITQEESSDLANRAWQGLLEAASDQASEIAARNPCRRFVELIGSVITSRRAHLTDKNGTVPKDPLNWGYREREFYAGQDEPPGIAYDPQGRCIGFVDGEDVFLDPESAYAEAAKLGDEGTDRLAVSKDQLFRRLKEQGWLASYESDKSLTRRTYQGRRRFFLHLRMGSLSPGKQGEQGEQGQTPTKPEENAPVCSPCFQGEDPKQGEQTGGIPREKPGVPPTPPVPPVSAGGETPSANGKNCFNEGTL
jgi:hypothetical protein